MTFSGRVETLIIIYLRFLGFLELENVYGFGVAGTAEEHRVHAESKAAYRDTSFYTSAKLE